MASSLDWDQPADGILIFPPIKHSLICALTGELLFNSMQGTHSGIQLQSYTYTHTRTWAAAPPSSYASLHMIASRSPITQVNFNTVGHNGNLHLLDSVAYVFLSCSRRQDGSEAIELQAKITIPSWMYWRWQ